MRVNNVTFEPAAEGFGGRQQPVEGPLSGWLERIPRVEAESALLTSVFRQSVVDLAALRVTGDLLGEDYVLPAAGLPWFMTLFGRDTLITSLQTLWVGPRLARGALHLLGALQGTRVDDFRDEEPGRILHEVRSGELTQLGEKPHSPYYGTADATPLWLILLSEYWRFTGQDAFVLGRWDKVAAALAWIDRYGDRDGDGYVEYQTRSREGLGNQCWKDSWDGVQFADGTIPYLPIATAEIQAYVYDAKLRVAELARRLRADIPLAERLEREAEELYARFNNDFWSEARGGYYVVGLDADKRPIDSMTSNMGHLLWSGIVPDERAGLVAEQLMSDAMFSGWGVRTLSTDDRGYNPIGYHIGTIWPHDNAIVALGLARAGFRDEANRIAWRSWRRPHSPATDFRRRSQASSAGSAAFPFRTPPPAAPRRGPPEPPSSSCRRCSVSRPATACFCSTRACPSRSAAFPFEGCMRSGRSGISTRPAPKENSAARPCDLATASRSV